MSEDTDKIWTYADLLERLHSEHINKGNLVSMQVHVISDHIEYFVAQCNIELIKVDYGSVLRFTGIGHASKNNVSGTEFHSFLPAVAETRAKARALKDLFGIRTTIQEEMPEFTMPTFPRKEPSRTRKGDIGLAKDVLDNPRQ